MFEKVKWRLVPYPLWIFSYRVFLRSKPNQRYHSKECPASPSRGTLPLERYLSCTFSIKWTSFPFTLNGPNLLTISGHATHTQVVGCFSNNSKTYKKAGFFPPTICRTDFYSSPSPILYSILFSHLRVNMCRWRQSVDCFTFFRNLLTAAVRIQDTYAHCGHMYRLVWHTLYHIGSRCSYKSFRL